jgi:hypothetical protein
MTPLSMGVETGLTDNRIMMRAQSTDACVLYPTGITRIVNDKCVGIYRDAGSLGPRVQKPQ